MVYKTFHLFAGAGGGIIADILLGHVPVGACEIARYPREVLLQRQRDGLLPFFPVWDDVCTLDGKPWRGKVDILSGGFPCQDISVAGKGAGIDGERSGLWREFARLIAEIKPKYVFVENSPLLIKRGLSRILTDLTSCGYNAIWTIMGAADVGASHLRKRLWLLAYSNSIDVQRLESEYETCSGKRQVGFCHRAGRLQQKYTWPTEPRVDRVVNGMAHRMDRIKCIGNGQVPLCAVEAWKYLINFLSSEEEIDG